jgi:four helix bundle protein
MGQEIKTHRDLDVYQMAFEAAMRIFELTRGFPKEETYSLVDQIRRSSRSVCSNIAEAWRKRRYEAAFVSKLNDSESEAAETQVWLEFSVKCHYLDAAIGCELYAIYESILGKLVNMILHPEYWTIGGQGDRETRRQGEGETRRQGEFHLNDSP